MGFKFSIERSSVMLFPTLLHYKYSSGCLSLVTCGSARVRWLGAISHATTEEDREPGNSTHDQSAHPASSHMFSQAIITQFILAFKSHRQYAQK